MSTYTYQIFQPTKNAYPYSRLYHAILDSIITVCLRLNLDLTPRRIEDAIIWSDDGVTFSSEAPAWIASEGDAILYLKRPWVETLPNQLAVAVGTHGTYVDVDLRSIDLRGGELNYSHCLKWLVKLEWLHKNHITRQNVRVAESPFEHAARQNLVMVLRRLVQSDLWGGPEQDFVGLV